jgi:hypothetical protein
MKKQEMMPTPNEILLKYLEPSDNSWAEQRIKESEEKIKQLKIKIKRQRKNKNVNSLSSNVYELDYNKRQVEYWNERIKRGILTGSARSDVLSRLIRYKDKPCVVAGIIENLMGMFIIRGKTKSFVFVVEGGRFNIGGYSFKIGSITDKYFFEMFEKIKQTNNEVAKIYNQGLYEQIKKEMIVNNITGNN